MLLDVVSYRVHISFSCVLQLHPIMMWISMAVCRQRSPSSTSSASAADRWYVCKTRLCPRHTFGCPGSDHVWNHPRLPWSATRLIWTSAWARTRVIATPPPAPSPPPRPPPPSPIRAPSAARTATRASTATPAMEGGMATRNPRPSRIRARAAGPSGGGRIGTSTPTLPSTSSHRTPSWCASPSRTDVSCLIEPQSQAGLNWSAGKDVGKG